MVRLPVRLRTLLTAATTTALLAAAPAHHRVDQLRERMEQDGWLSGESGTIGDDDAAQMALDALNGRVHLLSAHRAFAQCQGK